MHRVALVTVVLAAACGGNPPRTEPPSARAPEMATVAGCDQRTLDAFDPGLPGLERVAVEQRREPDPPLLREHARTCEIAELDEVCQQRARRDVVAADPDATIGDVAMDGDSDGWQAQLEVDGQRRELLVPQEADVIAEARRLQSLGHRVVPLEGRRVYREGSRRAIVHYAVPISRNAPRVRWEASLRWPLPPDIPVAVEQLQRAIERANLVTVRYEITQDGVLAIVACP